MATVTNSTDPNRNVSSGNVTPQQTSQAQPAPQVASSGNYSTLQKYLGANKGSGQRLATAVGGSVSNEALGLSDKTNTETDQSRAANAGFGALNTQTAGYTAGLNTGANTINKPVSKGYDVNQYSANLAGQDYANTIASNADELQKFSGVADAKQSAGTALGSTAQKTKNESDKSAAEALQASYRAYDTNKERQGNINNFDQRGQLLQKALNTQNQRLGIQNLDNALLSQDKSGTLNNVNRKLQEDVSGLQAKKDTAQGLQGDIAGLNTTQLTNEKALVGRMNDMQKQRDEVLAQRSLDVNTAKDTRKKYLNTAFDKFKDTGEVTQDLYDMLQLGNVRDVDATGRDITSDPVSQKMSIGNTMEPNKTTGGNVRYFNELGGKNVNDFLDTSALDTRSLGAQDVANQGDVDAYSNLAKLMGGTNNAALSKFTGRQIGESTLDDTLNKRGDQFLNEDLRKQFQQTGHDTEDIISSNWYGGKDKTGEAAADSAAYASLQDYLYGKGIYRNTMGTESSGGLGSLLGQIMKAPSNIDSLGNVIQHGADYVNALAHPGTESLLLGTAMGGVYEQEKRHQENMDMSGRLKAAGFTAGSKDPRYFGSEDKGAAMTNAENQSVSGVKGNLDNLINQIGYKNLVKLSGMGEEY